MRRRLLVTAPLIALLCLVLGAVSASAAGPAPVTDLRAQKSGASVILTWTHGDATANHYEVWWSDSPYAAIGDAGMVMIATVTPGAPPIQVTYTDTASGVGNTAVNSFYAVRGVSTSGETSALSNRAGEFDFGVSVDGAQSTPLPVVDHCGTIGANQTWGPNAVHRLTCNVTVASGVKLLLLPGTVVKPQSASTIISVGGVLEADGTATNPVYITSIKDDTVGGDTNNDGSATAPARGDWRHIKSGNTAGTMVNLTHTIVRYGGDAGDSYDGMLYVSYQASATLDHVTLAESASYGITLYAGSYAAATRLTMTDSTVENNTSSGIFTTGQYAMNVLTISNSTFRFNQHGIETSWLAAIVSFSGNQIYGNSGYGVYNGSASVFFPAEGTWWGSDSGPAPYGSGNGINYRTCYDSVLKVYYICQYYVDADPWIGKPVYTGGQLGNTGPTSANQAFVADPVNTANGNYAHQHTDIAIPTRGLSLDFVRAYNSLSPQAGPLGYGWTHNWNVKLSEDATDSSTTITFADGHSEHWTWTGAAYDGGPGVFGVLAKNGDGSFDLAQKDQTKYHFDAAGKLAWAEDKNANRTTLAYDGSDRLLTVAEPAGRALALAYTSPVSSTLISAITDHASRTTQYAYDANADLVTVIDVTGQATTMTYDANHRLLTVTDANTHTFVRNVYDTRSRVSEQYDALNNKWTFAYDEPGHYTLVTDPRNFVTTYTYDGDWRLISEKDALNFTASYAYDADNNRTQVTDKRSNVTQFTFDGRGNTTNITDTLGYTRTFTYDDRNNLLSETDQRSQSTTYAYDVHSNLLTRTDPLSHISSWTYDGYGLVATSTDARTNTTSYTYDAYGYPDIVTDPLSHVTSFVYDSLGRKTSETDAKGRTRTYTYDNANRLLTVNEPLGKTTTYTYDLVGNRTTVTENGTRTTQYAYDAKDRLSSVTDPLGHTTTYGYDTVDNQISVTDPLGHATTYTYDALNQRKTVKDALSNTTTYDYDANGNRTKVTDANSKVTTYAYDALNRLTVVTDAATGVVSYGYDAAGNRTSMTDANNHTTTYAYDEINRLTSTTDPLNHVTGYGYDAVGNRTSQTKPDGTTIIYAYDELNRLISITYPGGSVSYAYDEVGNRTTMTDATGVTTYTYGDLDRLIQVAGPNGTVSYGYDLFDNRTGLTYPSSQSVSYAYDLAGRLTGVTDYALRVTSYTYDDANRPIGISYPNGVQAAYGYDNADRLVSITHTHSTYGTIASAGYTVDAVSNRLSMIDPDGTTSYTYDNLYRLTQVAYPDSETVTYTYDSMGNRTAMTSTVRGTTSFAYDEADRLLSYTEPGGTVGLTWDDNGRMTGKGSATYTYDPLDRLTQVISGTTTVHFAYDGDGTRQSKTVNGTTTTYLQDLQAALPVVLGETTSGQTSLYLYGNDLVEQIDPVGTPAFYHTDGLGSTRALSDVAGQRMDAYSYDVFGATRSHAGSSGQPFTFAGEQTDGELGLVYLRARYYDPRIGRFLLRDPHPGALVSPQTLNKYVYASDNPVFMRDEDGEFVVPLIVIGIVGYTAYQAWDNFLDRSQQMETNMRGYYSFDFENPEWQQKYEDYNPAKDYQSALAAGVHAGVSTPGTTFSGPPPGITGAIGKASLISTLAKKFMFWLGGFKGPEPYRLDQGDILGVSSGGYGAGGYGGGGAGGPWGGPPSGDKE